MDKDIMAKAKKWTGKEFDEETRREVQNLLNNNNEKELTDMFYKELEFGTGGMRGVMGPGTNRMNIYTVGKASQGLSNYLLENVKDAKKKGIAIAYDSRNNSKLFAEEAASVFAANGINVYIFPELRPTPLLSFTVMELKAAAGIVITASHNPKEYNGYKVYCSEGYQITPPDDSKIVDYVNQVELIKGVKRVSYDEAKKNGLIKELDEEIDKNYLSKVQKFASRIERGLRLEDNSEIKVVYTPLHGTGITLVPKALETLGGAKVIKEPQQSIPDGNFPTTPSPNPEETAALQRAIELAGKKGADMVIATDPDCDRMGIAVPDENGVFVPINGNQIGSMFSSIIAQSLKNSEEMPVNPTIVTTIVSTELVEKIAKEYGIQVVYVLTGFKYIGEKMYQFEKSGDRSFIFGFEESYGYLADTFVRDKDGVIGSILALILVKYAKSKYGSVLKFLEEIYKKNGEYLEYQRSFVLKGIEGAEKIKGIMERLRENPPAEIDGAKVVLIKDFLKQESIDKNNNLVEKIDGLPKSNVLQFYTLDNVKISIRPSGTEPKIKFYFAVNKDFSGNLLEMKNYLNNKYKKVSEDLFRMCGLL